MGIFYIIMKNTYKSLYIYLSSIYILNNTSCFSWEIQTKSLCKSDDLSVLYVNHTDLIQKLIKFLWFFFMIY